MNVVFKVYWNNPIEMATEAGTQQLTFEVPLGAIIPNPSGLTNYYTKAETNTEITNAVSAKADKSYVDSENTKQNEVITTKASTSYVDTEIASVKTKETVITALGYTPAPTRKTVNPQSVSYQLQLSDANNIVRTTGATATNITVPNAATVAWTPQDRVEVEWYGAGQPTIVAGSGVTIQVAGGGSLTYSNRYETGILEYIGADEWVLYKDDLGGATSTTWVDISTLNGYYKQANISTVNTKIEVAKIGGMLWVRGYITTTNSIAADTEIFSFTDNNYRWDNTFYTTSDYDLILAKTSMYVLGVGYSLTAAQVAGGSVHKFALRAGQNYSGTITKALIQPVCIGKHL